MTIVPMYRIDSALLFFSALTLKYRDFSSIFCRVFARSRKYVGDNSRARRVYVTELYVTGERG